MNRLKLLTFDVANTILKIKDSPGHQYSAAAKNFDIIINASDLDKVYDNTWRKKKQDHPNYGKDHGMTTKDWWKGFVCQVFVNAGYKGNPCALQGVFDVLWQRFENGTDWEAIPHSHEALAALKNAGIKLGIVSNFDESLEKTLCVNHLDRYFDFVVTAANSGTEKPDPAIFRRALSVSGMTPSVSAHVGDNVSHDYLTPKSIGMTAFLFIQESASVEESLEKVDQKDIIRDLLDLNKIVTRS